MIRLDLGRTVGNVGIDILITIIRSARLMKTGDFSNYFLTAVISLALSGFYAPQYELLDPRTGRSISQGFKIIRYDPS